MEPDGILKAEGPGDKSKNHLLTEEQPETPKSARREVSFRHRPSIIDSLVVTRVDLGNADNQPTIHEVGDEDKEEELLTRKDDKDSFALYEEDLSRMPSLSAFIRTFTIPGAEEKEALDTKKQKAKLGVLLGVYLPTIQHIFGVIMFLRVFWIVGCAGVVQSFVMVFVCCLCTLLTSFSMSAIATNGVVESGGSYFMISRNLGPEFGTAVGILFYLANSVATAMYLIGGVEILLVYLAPMLPQFGSSDGHHNEQDMFNNFRLYATGLLLIEFVIVSLGVKFVQLFAPVSLSCVIISILAVYAGAFAACPERSPQVCMMGDRLLQQSAIMVNGTPVCNKTELESNFCRWNNETYHCDPDYSSSNFSWISAIPGFGSGVMKENAWPSYLAYGESSPGVKADKKRDVFQDIATNFFVLLAIYFPSVTGIMTGSNMSGDLKDPQRSIPIGTIAAQLTTSFVYLTFVLLFGGTITRSVMWDKYGQSMGGGMIVAKLAWPSQWILLIGSFTSTFGAALQCLCSAPRLLQSIAKDDVIPFLSVFRVINKRGEPFRALLMTTLVAECAILIGAIEYIAPVVDFFFLMCYGFVNIVCALQTLLRSPNWRPRFHFYHWTLSVLGAALCLFIMFATYWYYAIVTILLCVGIYKYVEYKGSEKEWGDGIRGLALSGARYSLLKIEDTEQHTKNWRPQMLLLMKLTDELTPKYRKMITLAGQLKAGRGLVVCASMYEGDYADPKAREQSSSIQQNLKTVMKEEKVKGFAQSVICTDVPEGINILIQSTGMGALRPNTVMVGWPYTWKEEMNNQNYYDFLDAIHRVATANMCLLIPKGISEYPESTDIAVGTIDVWWIMHDGGLLILLPFLLNKHRTWRKCKIRVYAVATQFDNNIKMKDLLNKWIYQLRIDAEVTVVELPGTDVTAYIHEKTLQMEERTKFIRELHMSKKEIVLEPQAVLDQLRLNTHINGGSEPEKEKAVDDAIPMETIQSNEYTFSPAALADLKRQAEAAQAQASGEARQPSSAPASPRGFHMAPDGTLMPSAGRVFGSGGFPYREDSTRTKTKKMHNAVKLNLAIKERSSEAELVIINLPGPPKNKQSLHNYIEYLEALTEGLDKVLLVRGTGKEVITIYS